MISFFQLKSTDEILALADYYVLSLSSETNDDTGERYEYLSMLQVVNHEVCREASTQFSDQLLQGDLESGTIASEQKTAGSIARLLTGSAVLAEPDSLQALSALLNRYSQDARIRFVPVMKLAQAVFKHNAESPIDFLKMLDLSIQDSGDQNYDYLYAYDMLFQECQHTIGIADNDSKTEEEVQEKQESNVKKPEKRSGRKRISNKTLHRWAENIWSGSLWVFIAAALIFAFIFMRNIPKKNNDVVDRNVAPVNYLVLSWDQTGKYGTLSNNKNAGEKEIQFRIPYGVYNVLNNNSIPVELNVITEGYEKIELSDENLTEDEAAPETLSKKSAQTTEELSEEEEDDGFSSVTLRPNSSRQITIDENQYLTLSEDAKELILFYLSEVPEEKESDTTGQDTSNGRVVYAYVKGTEVRFRRAPSLEGQIIDSMNDGQQVQVLGVTGEWTHVSVQNQKGYIFSQFLTSEDPNAVNPVNTDTETDEAAETGPAEESQEGNQPMPDTSDSDSETKEMTEAAVADSSSDSQIAGA